MSDLNLNQIQDRLNELFISYGERKLIFWFDPKKEFEEDIDNGVIQLENARIKKIDAHTQFLTKRFFELEDKENNYLLYAPFQRLSDEDNNKVTAVSLLGLQGAKDMVASYDETIRKELGFVSCDVTSLTKVLDTLLKRTY